MMKKAVISTETFTESTKDMNVPNDLGLTDDDMKSIREKLLTKENVEKLSDVSNIRISNCVPFAMTLSQDKDKPTIVNVLFLCVDADTNELFVIYHSYIAESPSDLTQVAKNPLFIENLSPMDSLMSAFFTNTLKSYIVDLDMYTIDAEDSFSIENDMFYMYGYNNDDTVEDRAVKLYVSSEVGNVLMGTDDFIVEGNMSQISIESFMSIIKYEGISSLYSDFKENTNQKCVFLEDIKEVTHLAALKQKNHYQVAFKIDDPHNEGSEITITKYIYIDTKKKLHTNINNKELKKITTIKDRYHAVFEYYASINDDAYDVMKTVKLGNNMIEIDSFMIYIKADLVNKLEEMIREKFGR